MFRFDLNRNFHDMIREDTKKMAANDSTPTMRATFDEHAHHYASATLRESAFSPSRRLLSPRGTPRKPQLLSAWCLDVAEKETERRNQRCHGPLLGFSGERKIPATQHSGPVARVSQSSY